MDTRDALLTYYDIALHYRLSRLTFTPPHKSLSQHHQHLWRELQANTFFFTPARLALFHPGTYSPHACPLPFAPKKSAAVGGCFVQHQAGSRIFARDVGEGLRG
ncbi:hypothetical protein HPB52_011949 [Rhipicephalus sanguineus]|uniref:Uncharacterized protein n=1 Tax=Rhipicephalus sanguineus TaxID=34632 RepID=A0A9D4SQ87_RHISA|nr:hypothetical protein HPB52_011949 [Rhipicephalus sanguineus]